MVDATDPLEATLGGEGGKCFSRLQNPLELMMRAGKDLANPKSEIPCDPFRSVPAGWNE
jgi:hypothetical protein